jgi:uncharacterized membrane protein YoaT (DUF817 family)
MDTFIYLIIVGFAVAFVTEFVSTILENWIDPSGIKKWSTLPLSVLGCWVAGIAGLELVLVSPAAAFVSLAALWVINRPITIQQVTTRRGV